MPAAQPRWGYHQLADRYARQLVSAAGIRAGELVVDLGAGSGAITRHLLTTGAQVIAVELHPGRAAQLRSRFEGERLTIIERDLETWRPPRQQFRVVANPPFSILAGLLRTLTASGSHMTSADVVVPAHVAARWSRGAGYRGSRCAAAVICRLPAEAFHPRARQATAILRLERRRRSSAD